MAFRDNHINFDWLATPSVGAVEHSFGDQWLKTPELNRIVPMVYIPPCFRGGEAKAEADVTGDRHMENKPAAQNIQDTFLNTARKERSSITIYLMSGVKLTGRIRSFDKYSVVLETNNQEQLIFKHAISTVAVSKGVHGFSEKPRVVAAAHPSEPNEVPPASGTEG
jgi:host factor-I protein